MKLSLGRRITDNWKFQPMIVYPGVLPLLRQVECALGADIRHWIEREMLDPLISAIRQVSPPIESRATPWNPDLFPNPATPVGTLGSEGLGT